MKLNHIALVVFDMAGTTVNENNVVYKTVRKALAIHGIEVSLETVLIHGAGKEKLAAIRSILDKQEDILLHEKTAEDIFETFQELLSEAYKNLNVTPHQGVEDLFKQLKEKSVKVVLNTGYDRKTALNLLKKINWKIGETIDALITADDVIKGRPEPEMIHKAMQLFEITDPQVVLKAGDSIIDIKEGQNANCGITVAVTSGAQTKETLSQANPTIILDNLGVLQSYF